MDTAKWIDLVVSLSFGTVFISLLRLYIQRKDLLISYFGLAAISITVPYFVDLFEFNLPFDLFEWGKLISITFYISGLLVLIRDSKPVFARFPAYLTALPFVSFLFFPLIIDSIVIKDLINAIYQGGALVVTLLVFALNQAKERKRRYYIIGISCIGIAYLTHWIIFNQYNLSEINWISEIFLSVGILFTTFRFVIGEQEKATD
ncbi:hypothetical protein [Gracilimonas tropica]|uniref:hypothetical protein n=1 Tax=Gracilimonas tropica TaxID=454600 RepID=UPI00037471D7|nr:hypothetical protein [Gracilimonas tropica]